MRLLDEIINIQGKSLNTKEEFDLYIKNEIKNTLVNEENVSTIYLNNCIINALPNFNEFSGIVTIGINGCIIKNEDILDELYLCSDLKRLNINDCHGYIILPKSMEKLSNLEEMSVVDTKIRKIGFDINNFACLNSIELNKNNLEIDLDQNFKHFKNITLKTLKSFSVSNCDISEIKFDLSLHSLKSIIIDNCNLKKLQDDILLLDGLETLSVEDNDIKDFSNLILPKTNKIIGFFCLSNPLETFDDKLLISETIDVCNATIINSGFGFNGKEHFDVNTFLLFKEKEKIATNNLALGIKAKESKKIIKSIHRIFNSSLL